jgi:type IV fimbrial biogenesis protein FimT
MNAIRNTQHRLPLVESTTGASGRDGRRRPQLAAPKARERGFTLLELMVTVGVAAVLMVTGVPSFVSFVQNNRATTDTNDLVTALNVGRNAATQRGAVVTVCSSSNGTTCSSAVDWSSGWIVLGPGNELLRSWPARSAAGVLVANGDRILFQPRGSVAATRLFRVRVPGCTGNQGRDVNVNIPGRVTVNRVNCI